MKHILEFAVRIMTVRVLVILLSLAQTTLWASELGLAGFGLVSSCLSAQILLGMLGRGGADNILVRQYRTHTGFPSRFPAYFRATILTSLGAAVVGLVLLETVLAEDLPRGGHVTFVALLLGFNLMQVQAQILLAQKRQVLVTLLSGILPLAISLSLFSLTLYGPHTLSASRDIEALGYLALGYFCAAGCLAITLRGFWALCRQQRRPAFQLFLGPEQWHFLGYQSLGLTRQQGITLAVAAIFGTEQAGLFALSLRFGNLLSYLNEPARMYVLPRVAGSAPSTIKQLYRKMLLLNAGLGIAGLMVLLGLYRFIPLPFDTAAPFPLYTGIILAGSALNLFVGPVGAILAQSGHESRNLLAHSLGMSVTLMCLSLAWLWQMPLAAVWAVALSNAAINLSNLLSLRRVLYPPPAL